MSKKKAIRDNIPDIIRNSGEDCKVKTLPDKEFLVEMEKKLGEEVKEYLESKSPEELADIIEVAYRISELRGISVDELERLRVKKAEERGIFSKNFFLEE